MQRTTISTYPHLVEIKPINGVVYKPTKIHRSNPKITVMPLQEVQMHQKYESVAELMGDNKSRGKLHRLKKKLKDVLEEAILCSDFGTADSLYEDPVPPARPIPLAHQTQKQASKTEEIFSPYRKVKKTFKKVLKLKSCTTPPDEADDFKEAISRASSKPTLKAGFVCAHNGCAQCSIPLPITPPNRAPLAVPVGPTIQHPPESMSSGFTTTTASSNSSSNPVSSTPTDLDIFQDFDGTHIEPTPPQIAPLRPISSFVSKLQATLIADIADLSQIEGDAEPTVPDMGPEDPAYPTPSVSEDGDWPLQSVVEGTPTPPAEQKLEQVQTPREWSFKENMPNEELEFLRRRGSVARRRRMAAA